jgi:hypothetical protein
MLVTKGSWPSEGFADNPVHRQLQAKPYAAANWEPTLRADDCRQEGRLECNDDEHIIFA